MNITQEQLDRWAQQLTEANISLVQALGNQYSPDVVEAKRYLVLVINALLREGAADPSALFYEQGHQSTNRLGAAYPAPDKPVTYVSSPTTGRHTKSLNHFAEEF